METSDHIEELAIPQVLEIWLNLRSATMYLLALAFIIFMVVIFNDPSNSPGKVLILIFFSIFLYFPATLILVVLLRSNVKGVEKGKGFAKFLSFITDLLLVIVGIVIFTNGSSNGSPIVPDTLILLILAIIYPIFTIYAIFINPASKEYFEWR